PLEVVPFTLPWVLDAVAKLGGSPVVRPAVGDADAAYLTDQHNNIVNCHFGQIPDPEQLARQLEQIPGIVEHGLFLGLAKAAIVVQGGQPMVLKPGEAAHPANAFAELP
ncbi:MAG: ribose-5-phosphate isomerase A, partial [Hymenobacter sp.]